MRKLGIEPLFMEDRNFTHSYKSSTNCCQVWRTEHKIVLMKLRHFLFERRLNESYQNILEVEQEVVLLWSKFDHVEDGFNLGEWVLTQRKSFKADKMTQLRPLKG